MKTLWLLLLCPSLALAQVDLNSPMMEQFVPPTAASAGPGVGNLFIQTFTQGTPRNDFAGCVGFIFTNYVNQPITYLSRYSIAGNSQVHRIGLFRYSVGVGTLIEDVTNTPSGVGYTNNIIAFQMPTNAPAGSQYAIMSEEFSGGDFWYPINTILTVSLTNICVIGDAYSSTYGATITIGGSNTTNNAYAFPNFAP